MFIWTLIKFLFGTVPVIGKVITWFENRKQDQARKSQLEAEEDAQILKDIKRAKDITDNKPLPDDLLLPPCQRGAGPHSED